MRRFIADQAAAHVLTERAPSDMPGVGADHIQIPQSSERMRLFKLGTVSFNFWRLMRHAPHGFWSRGQPQHLAVQHLPAVLPQQLIAHLQRHAHGIAIAQRVFDITGRYQRQGNHRLLIMCKPVSLTRGAILFRRQHLRKADTRMNGCRDGHDYDSLTCRTVSITLPSR
ncbi:hypothetical protein D3C71_1738630 [compost metagenome]